MNWKILELAQQYSNLAFMQGYKVGKNNVAITERAKLAKMPIALQRAEKFEEIFREVEKIKE